MALTIANGSWEGKSKSPGKFISSVLLDKDPYKSNKARSIILLAKKILKSMPVEDADIQGKTKEWILGLLKLKDTTEQEKKVLTLANSHLQEAIDNLRPRKSTVKDAVYQQEDFLAGKDRITSGRRPYRRMLAREVSYDIRQGAVMIAKKLGEDKHMGALMKDVVAESLQPLLIKNIVQYVDDNLEAIGNKSPDRQEAAIEKEIDFWVKNHGLNLGELIRERQDMKSSEAGATDKSSPAQENVLQQLISRASVSGSNEAEADRMVSDLEGAEKISSVDIDGADVAAIDLLHNPGESIYDSHVLTEVVDEVIGGDQKFTSGGKHHSADKVVANAVAQKKDHNDTPQPRSSNRFMSFLRSVVRGMAGLLNSSSNSSRATGKGLSQHAAVQVRSGSLSSKHNSSVDQLYTGCAATGVGRKNIPTP